MTRLIFLDIDGVLNCQATFTGPHGDSFKSLEPAFCDELQRIVQACWPCHIVLASTWRLFDNGGREKLNEWLGERMLSILSQTPDLTGHRGTEIQQWMNERPQLENVKFIIIDDSSDFLPEQMPFLIRTSFKEGLTKQKATEAIDCLMGQK